MRKRFKRPRELSQGSVGLGRDSRTGLKRIDLRSGSAGRRLDLARVVCRGGGLQRLEVGDGLAAHCGLSATRRVATGGGGGGGSGRSGGGGTGRGARRLGL